MRCRVLPAAFCLSLCGLPGCTENTDDGTGRDLRRIGLAYHSFNDKHARGPADLAELRPFVGDPAIESKLADGTYVVRYGIAIADMNVHGTSRTILAYHKDVPAKGGLAVVGDGSLYRLAAGEFDSFPPPPKRN